MVWTRTSDDWNDRPDLLVLPRGVRLFYFEGFVYANKHLTDGAIPTVALGRFTDEPDPEAAAARLVDAGLWAATDTGWQILNFVSEQRSKADVQQDQYEAKERQQRSRMCRLDKDHSECLAGGKCPHGKVKAEDVPSRRHKDGDHSLCLVDQCPAGAVTRDMRRDIRSTSRRPDQHRPGPLLGPVGAGAETPPPWAA